MVPLPHFLFWSERGSDRRSEPDWESFGLQLESPTTTETEIRRQLNIIPVACTRG